MTQFKPKTLIRTVEYDDHSFCIVQPGLVASFYISLDLPVAAPLMAETLESYIKFVGRDNARFYWAENGTMKQLNDRRVQRDLQFLRKLPKAVEGLDWLYSSSGDGGVGGHELYLAGQDAEPDSPSEVSWVLFGFPDDALESYGQERLLTFLVGEAQRLRIQSGNIGWGFKRANAFESEATREINTLLPRYLGFDPCYKLGASMMRDRTSWAHWINLLDSRLYDELGGEKALAAEAEQAQVQSLGQLRIIRAAKVPPIGDANRGLPDLGCLPGVARFLRPKRTDLDGLGDAVFDAPAWIGRFDGLPNRPWDNT